MSGWIPQFRDETPEQKAERRAEMKDRENLPAMIKEGGLHGAAAERELARREKADEKRRQREEKGSFWLR